MTAANRKLFRRKVCTALNGHTVAEVDIDLSQTTFMDFAGLGALIAVRNLTTGRNGVVRLMYPTSPVQQLLDLVRAGQVFEIVSTSPMDPSPGSQTAAVSPSLSEARFIHPETLPQTLGKDRPQMGEIAQSMKKTH